MKSLITGAAGFIGSHLTEALLARDHEVIALDCFTEYYDPGRKRDNVRRFAHDPRVEFRDLDLAVAPPTLLTALLEECEYVFHLAGQPGVRASWGDDFQIYLERNVWATQRLLEAARGLPLRKFVMASSSSVYGDAERYPTTEHDVPTPISPYGVSKLAAERLGLAYWRCFGVPVVALRYFTVYGPRQRPDMAFTKFIGAIMADQPVSVYGDGRQTRDFTFVSDAVEATISAATHEVVGEALNVGGGSRVSVLEVLHTLRGILERPVAIEWQPAPAGDVRNTGADLTRSRVALDYQPQVSLAEGLRAQAAWWIETAAAFGAPVGSR